MFLHRKETERLSNPWWWRPMQVCAFVVLLPVAVVFGAGFGIGRAIAGIAAYFYDWNRCKITSRPRPPWERMFEPKRKEPTT